ncbi:putative glycoside hydrolase [Bacteroidota bacterium]
MKITQYLIIGILCINQYADTNAQTESNTSGPEEIIQLLKTGGLFESPEFSWDKIPLYMHMRKNKAFTQEEIEYLAGFPLLTIEKTSGAVDYGSTEKGALAAAQGIKAINPNCKILYPRNTIVHYENTYDVDTGLVEIHKPFLEDSVTGEINLHRDIRPLFDLSNDTVRKWWVDHAVHMSNMDEIDGIFFDAPTKVLSSYMESRIGTEKKQAIIEGFHLMMEDCQERMNPSEIKLANLIRASYPNAQLDHLHYYNGSYLENFLGTSEHIAEGIAAAQTAAREGNIICLTLEMDDILPSINNLEEKDGYLVLPDSTQAVFDFYLAIFLTIAEEYSYFLVHDYYNAYSIDGDDRLWLKRLLEYDKSLGPPKGQAIRSGYIYTRQFENAGIYLDISKAEGRIAWGTDSIPYPAESVMHSLQFELREENSPALVSEALIEIDTFSALTNEAGRQMFSLDSGIYEYFISKTGYFPVDSSIHLQSDTSVLISMLPSIADVNFQIREGDLPLPYANVLLGEDAIQTNEVGLTVFTDLHTFKEYSWSVRKEGYSSDSGIFYLIADTTINVHLDTLSGDSLNLVNYSINNQLYIYPVPAKNYFMLESEKEILEIQVLDLSGRIIYSKVMLAKKARIEITEDLPNFCIIKVYFKDRSIITKRLALT